MALGGKDGAHSFGEQPAAARSASGSSTANSSPPSLPAMPRAPAAILSRAANSAITRSPAA